MASFHDDLLSAASQLLHRRKGSRGMLPGARIRRGISTIYYALFHFLLDEVARSIIGTSADLRVRRRMLMRSLTHGGMKAALERAKGANADPLVEDFLRSPGSPGSGAVPVPAFVREMATTFIDAQVKRHDADYNLNASLSAADAQVLHRRVSLAIKGWQDATGAADRDMKKALCLLLLLQGKIRKDP